MVGWSKFNNSATLGQPGSEQGVIVADEEHSDGARITLERDGVVAPWAITCGVYGAMVHTRFFGNEAEAYAAFDAMKQPLDALARMDQFREAFRKALDAFVGKFP